MEFLRHISKSSMGLGRGCSILFVFTALVACGEAGEPESVASDPSASSSEGKGDVHDQKAQSREVDTTTCVLDSTDEFDPQARLPKGPWEGECMNTARRRPVIVLEPATEENPTLTVANLFHDDGFWTARIPTDQVENVYFQLEYFPAVIPAGHTQLRLQFASPVRLEGQSEWNVGQTDEVTDLVLSIEAVTRVGDGYDLFRGTQDHYGIVFRIASLEARYDSMITQQGHHVEQWILDLEDDEKQALVSFYAFESEELALQHTYHTLFRNCTTEIVGTLDAVVQYTVGEQIKRFLVKVTEVYPNVVRAALIARGLLPLDQSTDWHPLEEDPTARF